MNENSQRTRLRWVTNPSGKRVVDQSSHSVTNCYNLFHEKACLFAQRSVYYSMIGKGNITKGENMVLMNGLDYIELDSVGSTLTKDLLVFSTDCSEAPETASEAEEMCGVHIYDLDSEWFTSLSEDDLNDFFYFIEITMI